MAPRPPGRQSHGHLWHCKREDEFMAQAYIVDALRTPTGKRGGALSKVHPVDLGAHVIKSLVARNAIPAAEYDDVIFGCLDQIGPQAGCIARTCWLGGGPPPDGAGCH